MFYFAEIFLYRIIFLVLGNVLMTTAWALSKSLVFYYSGAMTVGIVLVILMVLFQVTYRVFEILIINFVNAMLYELLYVIHLKKFAVYSCILCCYKIILHIVLVSPKKDENVLSSAF